MRVVSCTIVGRKAGNAGAIESDARLEASRPKDGVIDLENCTEVVQMLEPISCGSSVTAANSSRVYFW